MIIFVSNIQKDIVSCLAQLAERETVNLEAVGSIPTARVFAAVLYIDVFFLPRRSPIHRFPTAQNMQRLQSLLLSTTRGLATCSRFDSILLLFMKEARSKIIFESE